MATVATLAPQIEIVLQPPLYPKQEDAIFTKSRYSWIEATTKAGKTLGCMQWIIQGAGLHGNGGNCWWVAPVYPQTRIAYMRMKRGLLPYKEYGIEFWDGDMRIQFPNGGNIWCKSGDDPDNLYGEDVYRCVIDEASRVKEESYYALRSTLTATRGLMRAIGNVKGRRNWFYRMCRLAEQGRTGHEYHKLTAYDAVDAGVLEGEEIEDAKATLPENVFNELYLAEASDDGGNPFGLSHIDACVASLGEGVPQVFGVDLAKSHDYTVIIGLDRSGRTCVFHRFQENWEYTIKKVQEIVGQTYTLVDATGVGDPIFERLQALGSNVEAFKFTSASKQQIMEGLALSIQHHQISYPDNEIKAELETFEYEHTRTGVRYTAPAGYFDDCVCALALANKAKSSAVTWSVEDIRTSGVLGEFGMNHNLDDGIASELFGRMIKRQALGKDHLN
jgi:hypothetical protein